MNQQMSIEIERLAGLAFRSGEELRNDRGVLEILAVRAIERHDGDECIEDVEKLAGTCHVFPPTLRGDHPAVQSCSILFAARSP